MRTDGALASLKPKVSAPGRRSVYVAGSTGSIGRQALEVIEALPEHFELYALSAGSNVAGLRDQALRYRPRVVAVAEAERLRELKGALPAGVRAVGGPGALAELAGEADVVLNAIVGFAGLPVSLAALEAGRRLALANKESLVAAGPLVAKALEGGGELVPVDSEHSAIHQCLSGGKLEEVARLVLTASGGPFRGRPKEELEDAGPKEALAHPTWRMGAKITVDSSTLMNKGLEVIEAHVLFGLPYERIEVVVHPQSIVHSMVVWRDGSVMAQLSRPDMRLPIGYALGWPRRLDRAYGSLDFDAPMKLEFERPSFEVFRCLGLAYEAGKRGGLAPTWLNAANEVAVEAFLAGRIGWGAIADVVEGALASCNGGEVRDLEDVIEADGAAREVALELVGKRSRVC